MTEQEEVYSGNCSKNLSLKKWNQHNLKPGLQSKMKTPANFEIQINSLIQARRPNFIEDLPDHRCGCVSGGQEGNKKEKKGKIAGYHLGAEETVEHDSSLCTYNMWNT